MYDFLAFIFFVFGVLQIILFFKMWGMTNNVKKIKEKFSQYEKHSDIVNSVKIISQNGGIEKSLEIYRSIIKNETIRLHDRVSKKYATLISKTTTEESLKLYSEYRNNYYKVQYQEVVDTYKPLVKILGDFDFDEFDEFDKVSVMIESK